MRSPALVALLSLCLTASARPPTKDRPFEVHCFSAAAGLLPLTDRQKQRLEEYRVALVRYREVFELRRHEVERGDPPVPRARQKNVSRNLERGLKALLEELNIPHRAYATKKGLRIYVDPSSGHGMGNFVSAMLKAGIRTRFEPPQEALDETTRGMFNFGELMLSYEILVDMDPITRQVRTILTPTGVERHEARHFGIAQKMLKGQQSIYFGEVWPREKTLEGLGVYNTYLSMEEALTYSADYLEATRSLRKMATKSKGPSEEDLALIRKFLAHATKIELIPQDDRGKVVEGVHRYADKGVRALSERTWMEAGQHELSDGSITWANEIGYTSFDIKPASKEGVEHVRVGFMSGDGDVWYFLTAPEDVAAAKQMLASRTSAKTRLALAEGLLNERVMPLLKDLQETSKAQLEARTKGNLLTIGLAGLMKQRDSLPPGRERDALDRKIWKDVKAFGEAVEPLKDGLHR